MKHLSEYTDAEIAWEHYRRAQKPVTIPIPTGGQRTTAYWNTTTIIPVTFDTKSNNNT